MEIGVFQSIFTQKNTTDSTGLGYSSTATWDKFWIKFKIFLDVEIIFFFSLGFRFSFLIFLIHFPCYYWLYISNQHKGEGYTLA